MSEPQIWHYGLIAREWGELGTDGGREGQYFQRWIEANGQPALDLGCGSGRLLLPYLRAGLDVDGCDYSEDMLGQCAARSRQEGLAPRLYAQAMHELDLPRRYQTIIACGVIGLGGERRLTLQAMYRCFDHLKYGGALVFDYQPRWNDRPAWLSRLPEGRRSLPQDWPTSTERRKLGDGTEIEIATRTVSMDPLEEVATRQIRARLWRAGELLKEEIHTQRVEDYSKNELVLMLERAGFGQIQLFGDYTDEPATMDSESLVFVAKT
jgi:SAM-dependent methyltransferase